MPSAALPTCSRPASPRSSSAALASFTFDASATSSEHELCSRAASLLGWLHHWCIIVSAACGSVVPGLGVTGHQARHPAACHPLACLPPSAAAPIVLGRCSPVHLQALPLLGCEAARVCPMPLPRLHPARLPTAVAAKTGAGASRVDMAAGTRQLRCVNVTVSLTDARGADQGQFIEGGEGIILTLSPLTLHRSLAMLIMLRGHVQGI
jgi:hypothetical protein